MDSDSNEWTEVTMGQSYHGLWSSAGRPLDLAASIRRTYYRSKLLVARIMHYCKRRAKPHGTDCAIARSVPGTLPSWHDSCEGSPYIPRTQKSSPV